MKAIPLLTFAIVLGFGLTYYYIIVAMSPPGGVPEIQHFDAVHPHFVVQGNNLGRVELWAVPPGTVFSEDEDDYLFLGFATATTTKEGLEMWLFPIPEKPFPVEEIIAKGFNKGKQRVVRVSLPYTGESEIHAALWPEEEGVMRKIVEVGDER